MNTALSDFPARIFSKSTLSRNKLALEALQRLGVGVPQPLDSGEGFLDVDVGTIGFDVTSSTDGRFLIDAVENFFLVSMIGTFIDDDDGGFLFLLLFVVVKDL